MVTEPNQSPSPVIPEKFPGPPTNLPPNKETPTFPSKPQLPDDEGPLPYRGEVDSVAQT